MLRWEKQICLQFVLQDHKHLRNEEMKITQPREATSG